MSENVAVLKEIGGYLDISVNFLQNAKRLPYALNAARYCLEYILRERQHKTVWIPYCGCRTLTTACKRAGIQPKDHALDSAFSPSKFFALSDGGFIVLGNPDILLTERAI